MTVARKLLLSCASTLAIVGAVGLGAGPALAHIDPDPPEAPAGSDVTVGFTVEHGCEGSPTVELRMRLPDGVTSATPEPPIGWNGALEDNVVSFTGGSLADDVEGTFRVRMVLPLTPATTIYFPFVQRCEVGEIAWIDVPADDSGTELDEPAPGMMLTAPLPGTTDATPTTLPVTTMENAEVTIAAESDDDTGKGSGGTVVLIVTLAVIFAGGAVVLIRARRSQ